MRTEPAGANPPAAERIRSSISAVGSPAELLPRQLRELGPRELLVNEFFSSIQGESSFAGRPCFFIRLTGCHLRCSWCDTEHAFHEGRRETVESCHERVRASGLSLVEITGGEPLLQKAAFSLISELCDDGRTVLVETSGAVPLHRVDPRAHKIVDVKTPSSGMQRYNLSNLAARLGDHDELKLVLNSREDYLWARAWLEGQRALRARGLAVHFSPVHERLAAPELARWILEDGLPVRLNVQIHKVLWPGAERGV